MKFKNGDPFFEGHFSLATRECPHCGGTQYDWGCGWNDREDGGVPFTWKCHGEGGCGAMDHVHLSQEQFTAARRPKLAEILAITEHKDREFFAGLHGYELTMKPSTDLVHA